MASDCPFSAEDLLCPVCCEVFTFPVKLTCQHNFCKVCIQSYWEQKESRECPLCRHTESSTRPRIDLALKIASDNFKKQASEIVLKPEELCSIHNAELKLFCQKDAKLICLVCHSSRDHKDHDCCPIAEAAADRKKEISSKYDSLRKHLHAVEKLKGSLEELEAHIKTQAAQTEAQIRDAFEKLHKFLKEEEAARVLVLKEETARKTQLAGERLQDITQTSEELAEILAEIERSLKTDDISFLKDCKEAIRRASYTPHITEYPRDALIDTDQYLGSLSYTVWRRMGEEVKHCPVVLNPNTAHPNLIISNELSSVCHGKKQNLPDNPERCTSRLAVLASTGFISGKHSWEVEVGENREWYIGVARESFKRKTNVFLNPSEGFWVIGLNNGETYWAQMAPRTRLSLKRKPMRVTVELDYEKGKVVFLNSADGSTIHTFKDKFTEKLFPYFSPGIHKDGQHPLKICPLKVSIMLHQHVVHS
ncbi:nuclear factor 7, ovary-like [Astyanax mexicanus]|uniref:Nuclear factor 7, ovary-like n=1 Tax=Astyanax mexicanus TaxID=7994 RepID=A0A8B9KE32_ASTMX|nr:nuclear factor 7, ovary-like [Astyanax mexicanus]